MSKLRPSSPVLSSIRTRFRKSRRNVNHLWLRRVFHNTYTRKGQRHAVRGWSVKIQHHGRRRTFSLPGQSRTTAAVEAQVIYQRILNEGWQITDDSKQLSNGRAFSKADGRYWKERLLLRKFRSLNPSASDPELSVRLGRAGTTSYFPLGASNPDDAAAMAVKIHDTILDQGWDAAIRIFPREVCIAFHWASVPLLWTYTTLHTLPKPTEASPKMPLDVKRPKQCFLLVEPDPGIRRALVPHLQSQPSWSCIQASNAGEAGCELNRGRATFCLINAELQEQMDLPTRFSLTAMTGKVPALTYSVHPDSDEVFAGSPGGISSYLFIRLPPHRLLEPVHGALRTGPSSLESLRRSAQSYFQMAVQIPPEAPLTPLPARLTQREKEVISLLGKGCIDKEIAHALGISAWTVHGHVKRLFKKLHVHSRLEAVLAYLQK